MTANWSTVINGIYYRVTYDMDSGRIIEISDGFGGYPRANIDRECIEHFERWWADQRLKKA